jgi:hypothetical protein
VLFASKTPESVLFASETEHNPLILCYDSASSLFTQLTMPHFEVKQSAKLNLTSYSGLALIGQCCQAAQVGQRLDTDVAELRELTDELTLRLLERTQAPITAYKGYVCADLDTFRDGPARRAQDATQWRSCAKRRIRRRAEHNSDTKKEAVSRTYQGIDMATPRLRFIWAMKAG